MSWLAPLDDEQMSADQTKAFTRAKKKLGFDAEDAVVPEWVRVLANSPALLKDTYMNLDRNILRDGPLTQKTRLIIATAVASHAGNAAVSEYFAARAIQEGATDEELVEAAGIAATSTSFNYYYKFRSMVESDAFEGFNAGLRASLFVSPSQGKAMAELINIVISAINGCKSCVNGHIQDAANAGVTRDQIDDAVRIGGIVTSICTFTKNV